MKLVHPNLEKHLEFNENNINVLVLESPIYFRAFIEELNKQIIYDEGNFILSENHKELKLSKNIELILDLFNFNFTNRKITNKIIEEAKTIALDEDYFQRTLEIISVLEEYMISLVDEFDYPIKNKEKIEIDDILKIFDFKIDEQDATWLEKIVAYLEVCQRFLDIKLFVLVNFKRYLTNEELKAFYKQVSYKNISLLLIEQNIREDEKFENEKIIIVDEDLCEIY